MRMVLILAIAWMPSAVLRAAEKTPLDSWVFPKATMKQRDSSPVTVTSADKKNVQSYAPGLGQYVTDEPFHEVLAFYIRKSGLKPPNWSILGREYPGSKVHLPAHFYEGNIYREEPSVTLLHYIRENVATAQLLVTDHPELGFITVSITRAKDDDQTLIQLIQHPSKAIKRVAVLGAAPELQTSR